MKSKASTTRTGQGLPAKLADLMNVGRAVAEDLRLIGIRKPADLVGKDPYELFERLCRKTKQKHDPCMLDTFIAITRFADGEPERPWWKYTKVRQEEVENRAAGVGRRKSMREK